MKLKITLSGTGGDLDETTIDVPEPKRGCPESRMIKDVIETWTLSAGDTISIVEVQS